MAGHRLHERIWRRLQTEGLGRTVRRALRAAQRRVIRHVVVPYYGIDLTKPVPQVRARVPVEFRWATSEEVKAMVALMPANEQANERREGRPGDRHWVGVVDGAIVFIVCVSPGREVPPSLQSWVGEPQAAVYLRGVYTLPEHRGGGLMAAALASVFTALAAEGTKYAWARARYDNIPSLRSQIKAGMNIIGAESYWQVLGLRCGTEWT
ncbi:MAG: GNAT family N-acetyltransferase [Armatimonadetes bacterium]|nr:GNAT family N-acetyltransferase [Armatimonadota bacterium]